MVLVVLVVVLCGGGDGAVGKNYRFVGDVGGNCRYVGKVCWAKGRKELKFEIEKIECR